MTQPAPRKGTCPNCGAEVEFKLGASLATVCAFCQAVVVRKGQDFEAIGKVADLVPTGSRLALGTAGRFQNVAFELIGRLQYEWRSGVWDEWYVAFADGRWGWLSEAQGRFYLTMPAPPRTLPGSANAGERFFFEGLGRFTVTDVKEAKIVGVAGELPEPVTVGAVARTADLEGQNGAFATLDSSGDTPVLYVGQQVPFAGLHLDGAGARASGGARPAGEKLACSNCGAPITLRVPEQAIHVVCDHCHSLLDASKGAFRVIQKLEQFKHRPRIPLGASGRLRGRDLLLVGWMRRSCVVDGARYPWDEYLLFDAAAQGFVWLVESEGHWQLATPISAGDVVQGSDLEYQGRRFRLFSTVTGVVDEVLGEFYWEVKAGDAAQLDDYIRPPEGLSREKSEGEVNWSHVEHLDGAELAKAFDRPALRHEEASGVGATEPWPFEASWSSMSRWLLWSMAGLFALMLFFAFRPTPTYLDEKFDAARLAQLGTDTAPDGSHSKSFLSTPFELGKTGAIEVEFSTDVEQSWAYASGAVINDASGESAPFGLESSHYVGSDPDGSWSEGSSDADEAIESPGPGKALVRADLQWDPKRPDPPAMHLKVSGDSFSGGQFFAALLLLAWPLLLLFHRQGFERRRWDNSSLGNPYRRED